MTELANARIVAPLWCVESVQPKTGSWIGSSADGGMDFQL
jgi:hypothetical protein